ncbi:Recombination inhibitory protein MutS2 [hydrothermal vent metagenome]|uniref:Recombination inhibitory protein MutS2 n=1 Tax=hydrothermal vent metagenome TaxID=652676 RepID=A0A3B1CF35_9ZZZZ
MTRTVLEKSGALIGSNEIIEALKNRASTTSGKDVLHKTKSAVSLTDAQNALDETEAMIGLLLSRPDFYIEPCEDPSPFLIKVRKAQTLDGTAIRSFLPILKNGEKISLVFEGEAADENHPLWTNIPSVYGLASLIDESIDEDGAVRPNATPEIERLSKAVNAIKRSIREKAEALLKDTGVAPMLMDEYVTLRENRFVLPIRAEHKSHVEGIIHDSSNTGQTFFIEPKALIDLNNKLKTQEIELAHEVARLLAELSHMISEEEDAILKIHEEITRLDVISAKGRLSLDLGGSRPIFGNAINLKNVANPMMLLENKNVVRNSIAVSNSTKVVIISGPNTGGKTVAMKTIGLLSLMAKMGLYITAEESSQIPFYKSIYADIGDSQSISADLSTFSAHLVNMNEIIEHAGESSLVLLDELMVSTDPKEGSALAVAMLDHLISRGAEVVVTTHFNELKIMAQSQVGYHNISMEFDALNARPTYRMVDGAPGSSSALAVAEKLGLPSSIISSAKLQLEGGDERIENALRDLREQKIMLERERTETEKALKDAIKIKEAAQKQKDEIAEREREFSKNVKKKLSADIGRARLEISDIVEKVREKRHDRETLREARQKLNKLADESKRASAPIERISRDALQAGDNVYIIPLEKTGKATSKPSDGKIEVIMGTWRMTVNLTDVVGTGKGPQSPVMVKSISAPKRDSSQTSTIEMDIRGMRAEEAIEELVNRLDIAMDGEADKVRIIHGKGTGALRKAVREYLVTSPYVADFASEEDAGGGDGATLVTLK